MKRKLSLLSTLLMSSVVTIGLASCDLTGQSGSASETPSSEPTVSESAKPSSTPSVETPSESTALSEVYSEPIEVSSEPSVDSSQPSVPVTPTEKIDYDPNKETTITFYSTMGTALQTVFTPMIEAFQILYPKITVNHEAVGGYDEVRDKIKTELSSNAGPNLAYCYPDHVALYNLSGKVQTLDKFINNTETDENGNLLFGLTQEQQDDFVEGFWNEGQSFGNGLMYSLPFVKSTEVLYYNKTELDTLGLEVPTHWFKDDAGLDPELSLEYACEKLLEAHPNDVPFGYDSEANWFITMCEQLGTDYTSTDSNHFLFDNEENRHFVEKLKEWYDKKYFTTQKIENAYTSSLFTNQDSSKKTCYLCIGSSAGASHQVPDGNNFDVGIAPIPQVNPSNPKVISQGPSICIFKKADKQQVAASWLFLRFITTNLVVQATMAMSSGYVPAIKSVYRNEIYAEFLDGAGYDTSDGVIALSAQVCSQQSSAYFTSPAFVGSSEARDQVGNLMAAVFTGTKTVDQAFKDAINECLSV